MKEGQNSFQREQNQYDEGTEREYLLSFSSFYKAAYALDIMEAAGHSGTLKKLPPELVRSCGTGVHTRTKDIKSINELLRMKAVYPSGIYMIDRLAAGGSGSGSGSGVGGSQVSRNGMTKRYVRIK